MATSPISSREADTIAKRCIPSRKMPLSFCIANLSKLSARTKLVLRLV